MLEEQCGEKVDDKTITVHNVPVKNLYSCLEKVPVEPQKQNSLQLFQEVLQTKNSNESVPNELGDVLEDELEEELESEEWDSLQDEQFNCYSG